MYCGGRRVSSVGRVGASNFFCERHFLLLTDNADPSRILLAYVHKVATSLRPYVMFSLLYGFYKLIFRKAEFHILILGLDGAGKTSILERLKAIFAGLDALPPSRIPPTVGLNIGRMRIGRTQLSFWDLGGQSRLRSLWEQYYSEAHGLLFVVDSNDAARLDESRDVLRGLLHHPDLAGIPILLFANKQDAPGAASSHEVQARFGLHQQHIDGTGSSQPQNVLGVTALSGDGVEEGIRWLVDAVRCSPRAQALSGGEGWGARALDGAPV